MKIDFSDYSDKQKKIMQDVLMFSPKCWKDGNFKFDRDKSGVCDNKNCYTCMFENFNLSTDK